MEDERSSDVLVWKVEKTRKLDFALDFCYVDMLFSKGKDNNREEAKKLINKLILQEFSASLRFCYLFHRFSSMALFQVF